MTLVWASYVPKIIGCLYCVYKKYVMDSWLGHLQVGIMKFSSDIITISCMSSLVSKYSFNLGFDRECEF